MKLSIVTTLYESSDYIVQFCERASNAAKRLVGNDYEIVLVNDGSPDNSLDIAINQAKDNPNIIVVDLSRNFGHHKAMMTALEQSKGDFIFLLDGDLEEKPEWVQSFKERMNSDNCDVVYGVQATRKGAMFERLSGNFFYNFFRLITGLRLPQNIVTARLMTRRYVNALVQHKEREVFMAGLWYITGFHQQPYMVVKESKGKTTYNFRRKMSLVVNSVTSFSSAPLVSIFYFGTFISLLSFSYIAYLCIHWIFLARPMSGWTSVMASIWLLGGMIISFIGIVGIYVSKIFSETKQRPYTIIKDIYAKAPKID